MLFTEDQNCHSDYHLRWRAVRVAYYFIYFAADSDRCLD